MALQAVSEKAVKAAKFAFYLASSGSELYLGGANTARYTGSIETHPGTTLFFTSSFSPLLIISLQKVTVKQFWQIGGGKSTVNGVTVATGISTVCCNSLCARQAADFWFLFRSLTLARPLRRLFSNFPLVHLTVTDCCTNFRYAPTAQVKAFYKAIGGSVYDASQGVRVHVFLGLLSPTD